MKPLTITGAPDTLFLQYFPRYFLRMLSHSFPLQTPRNPAKLTLVTHKEIERETERETQRGAETETEKQRRRRHGWLITPSFSLPAGRAGQPGTVPLRSGLEEAPKGILTCPEPHSTEAEEGRDLLPLCPEPTPRGPG